MDELVRKLSVGTHRVEVVIRPEANTRAFQKCIEGGYLHIRFLDTEGGTELGLTLEHNEREAAQVPSDDRGVVKVVGKLVLNYVPVKCIAEIDLSTLTGRGRLEAMVG